MGSLPRHAVGSEAGIGIGTHEVGAGVGPGAPSTTPWAGAIPEELGRGAGWLEAIAAPVPAVPARLRPSAGRQPHAGQGAGPAGGGPGGFRLGEWGRHWEPGTPRRGDTPAPTPAGRGGTRGGTGGTGHGGANWTRGGTPGSRGNEDAWGDPGNGLGEVPAPGVGGNPGRWGTGGIPLGDLTPECRR